MNWHPVAVVKMTSLLVLLTAKLESIKETNHEEDKALDLGLEGEAPSVTARFLCMCVCVYVAHARYVWLQVNVKGDPEQTQRLAWKWKRRNCENISICRLCTTILSVLFACILSSLIRSCVGFFFTSKKMAHDVTGTCALHVAVVILNMRCWWSHAYGLSLQVCLQRILYHWGIKTVCQKTWKVCTCVLSTCVRQMAWYSGSFRSHLFRHLGFLCLCMYLCVCCVCVCVCVCVCALLCCCYGFGGKGVIFFHLHASLCSSTLEVSLISWCFSTTCAVWIPFCIVLKDVHVWMLISDVCVFQKNWKNYKHKLKFIKVSCSVLFPPSQLDFFLS